jgi:serine/threonine-protein kinase PRP4
MTNLKGKDLGALLQGSARGTEDKALLANFKDLLERVLTLDPEKRLDVSAALKHPFISGK